MKLFICGNGFDLNHGLNTGYKCYKEFLLNFPTDTHDHWTPDMFNESKYLSLNKADRWTKVEEALTLCLDMYIDDFIAAFHPNNRINPNDPSYTAKIEVLLRRPNPREGFISNIQSFTGINYYNWISRVGIPADNRRKTLITPDALYITFNYTTTLETFYSIPPANILYLHGCIKNIDRSLLTTTMNLRNGNEVLFQNNSIVHNELQFGSIYNNPKEAEARLRNRIKEHGKFVGYDKFFCTLKDDVISYCQCTYKDIKHNQKALRKFIEKPIDEIHIMGHSILGVDKGYYEDIIVPKFRYCDWHFYCHNPSDCNAAEKFVNDFGINHYRMIDW